MSIQLLISISTLGLLLAANAMASEFECQAQKKVMVYSPKKGHLIQERELKALKCNNSYEGKNFKIVNEASDEVIDFNASEEIQLKAANVYYHLMLARDYWVNEIKSDFVANLEQITVRINIRNAFSAVGHFQHLDVAQNFNNAWTVPAGKTPSFVKEQDDWGLEIWFSPAKKMLVSDFVKSSGRNPIALGLKELERPVLNYTERRTRYDVLNHLFDGTLGSSSFKNTMLTHLGTVALTYGSRFFAKKMDHMFLEKYFYLDTAMVPDIIYHEFSHVALSDYIVPVHSSPVIEGMADYFATRIANKAKMYGKIPGVSSNRTKDRYSKQYYHPYLELDHNADRDFVLSTLWLVKEDLDKLNENSEVVNADQLIFKARTKLNHSSDIMNHLSRALIDSCYKNCKNRRLGVSSLHRSFEKKGF